MNLIELSELLLNEDLAEQYLLKTNILKTFTHCEKCHSTRLSKISRGRYRCNACESEWSERKDSILHRQNITPSNLIGLIKLFALDLTATSAATELDLNTRTVQRIYGRIREAIIGEQHRNTNTLTDVILKDESTQFTITTIDNAVSIDLAKDDEINSDNLFTLKRTRVPNREPSFHFKHQRVNSKTIRRKITEFPVAQNYFWRFANEKLLKFRGTKLQYLFTFLKEIEFRYNNNEDLDNKIVAIIARFEGWR